MKQIQKLFCMLGLCACLLGGGPLSAQQPEELVCSIDASANTVPLPKVYKPSVDLSGRGSHRQNSWPQALSDKEALSRWQKDLGFSGIYRLQYDLWEISQLAKDKELQEQLLSNYESVMRQVTEAGGAVIVDLLSTPPGLGKALDKKSAPWNIKAFKELVKALMRDLSCNKRYNLWYEVWSAPDLDAFFLGSTQEYLMLYRAVAEAARELEQETKVHIPVGGPSPSWWFQAPDGNTIMTPERSLIYELIRFCARYKLPLDFVTWHLYATDPKSPKEMTRYKKHAVALIRDWLSYFGFDRLTPLIVSEWNYDYENNIIPERSDKAYIAASAIPAFLKHMHESGIDYQLYYCLEDFRSKKEGVARNVGVFWAEESGDEAHSYKGGPKLTYDAFRMLGSLGSELLPSPLKHEADFVGVISTRSKDRIAILAYNYIDAEIARSYLSRNIATLTSAGRKQLVNLVKSGTLKKLTSRETDLAKVRVTKQLRSRLKKALELHEKGETYKTVPRPMRLEIKNLKSDYRYQRYSVDASSVADRPFVPQEEKDITPAGQAYQETLSLLPYSVQLIILERKSETTAAPAAAEGVPAQPPVPAGK